MEKVIYSNKGGLGIILNDGENEYDFILEKSFTINGSLLNPGDNTELGGMFDKPVKYVGALNEGNHNCMVFYLGLDKNYHYYSCFYWITENRIANKYKENTARDFNWVNGKYK
jgi:hypothetical protein